MVRGRPAPGGSPMRAALVDNGSLEPAAHAGLRTAAASIGKRTGTRVDAVSWRHSDRIQPGALEGGPAWTLAPWVRARVSEGERRFVFIPFFISPRGEIGSALRRDLAALGREQGGFKFSLAEGLAAGTALAEIVADRVREAAAQKGLRRPAVVVVDHGGPSPLCTKNVFLKYYSKEIGKMMFWGKNDRDAYRDNIVDTLTSFFAEDIPE